MDRREFIRCGVGLAGIIVASKAPAYISKSILAGKVTMIADVDDATHEVEWVQGDGAVGILLPYNPYVQKGLISVKYARSTLNTENIFGAYTYKHPSNLMSSFQHLRNHDNLSSQNIRILAKGSDYISGTEGQKKAYEFSMDYQNLCCTWWNGKVTEGLTDTDYYASRAIGLFGVANKAGNAMSSYTPCKIYWFKIEKDGVLIYDLVPVRIGREGYMYDRVSETFLEPVGTGKFIVGPDKRQNG